MTLPNGAAGISYTDWGITGTDGSLPDQATRTEAAIKAALRDSYTAQIQSSTIWQNSLNNFLEGLLKQVWTALTGGLIDFDTTKTAFEQLASWAANLVLGGISEVLQQFETFLSGIPGLDTWLDTLKTIIDSLLNVTGLSTFLDVFKTLINGLTGIANLENWVGVFTQVVNFFTGIAANVRDAFFGTFKTLIDALSGIVNFENWVATFKTLIDGLTGILNLDTWVATFKTLINGLLGITNFENWVATFKQVTDFFNNIASNLRAAFLTSIKTVVDFFSGLIGTHGSLEEWLAKIPGVSDVLQILRTITGANAIATLEQGITELVAWTQKIPVVGSLVSSILNGWKNPVTGTGTTLADLVAYAGKLLTDETVIPSINLFGFLPFDLLSMIPVGHVGDASPNLISDTGFETEAAVQAGNGWTWDATTNNTNSTGGSVKVTGDGGVRQILSNMIQVAAGQTLDLSVAIKWSKPSAATPTFLIGLRGYDAAGAQTFTKTVASVIGKAGYTTSNTTATYTVGANTTASAAGGWVTVTGKSDAIPMGTTQVRIVLGMNNGPAGTSAWYDDAIAQKTQKIQQGLVSGLITDLLGKLPNLDFQSLLTTIAGTPGATLTSVANALAQFLTGSSTLNGSNILNGNISPAVIKDLIDTWVKTVFGVTNGNNTLANEVQAKYQQFQQGLISAAQFTTYLTSVLSAPGDALQNFVQQMTGQGGRITNLESERDKAKNRLDILENALNSNPNGVLARLKALEDKANFTTVTPPSTTPTIVSVTDDFERASLGSNWNVIQVNSDGSTIGIVSGDAKLSTPALSNTCSQVALAWNGTGKAALTGYQRISTTLGSASSVPLIGSPGFNDLIAKAAPVNPRYGIVCRYYASGVVKFFYRLGNWETDFFNPENTFGTFTAVAKPTAGTLFEFYAGDKTVSDQTKCYAKIGTSIVGPAYIGATPLGQLSSNGGTGWGFGMGNGLSGLAPQPSASLNYWSAQDQA